MKQFFSFRSSYAFIFVATATAYALFAKLMLSYFSSNGIVSMIWPSSGIALAALIIGGKKVWPAIFVGAFAANFLQGSPIALSLFIAFGNTLEALACLSILSLGATDFDSNLIYLKDYIRLVAAALTASLVSASIGTAALWLNRIITAQQLGINFLDWWQGDLIGIILITPLILVWRHLPRGWFNFRKTAEIVACFGLTIILSRLTIPDWPHENILHIYKIMWTFAFILWAATRFGIHVVLLLIVTIAFQILFRFQYQELWLLNDQTQLNLFILWMFILTLSLVGTSLALIIREKELLFDKYRITAERLKLAMQSGRIGIWEHDIKAGELIWDDSMLKLYGMERKDFFGTYEDWSSRLHPDDKARVEQQLHDFYSGKGNYDPDFRILWPNGEVHYIKGHAHIINDASGEATYVIGTNWDNSEKALAKLELELSNLSIENSRSSFYRVNSRGIILYVNEFACKSMGYEKQELIGQPIWLIDPNINEEKWKESWEGCKSSGQRIFESLHRRKDGELFPVEITANYLNIQGKEYSFSMVHDITSRRQNESRIERLGQLYKAISEINQAIVRMEKIGQLFPLVCRCSVQFGGMAMAWIGLADERDGMIKPVSSYGSQTDYLDNIKISTNPDVSLGLGPGGKAWREGKPVIVNNFFEDSSTVPWQAKANLCGWKSMGCFPILKNGKPFAILAVYHTNESAFDNESIVLFQEMSKDVSFAIDNFEREEERVKAEESLRLAASVYDASSEAIMITDANNSIIGVNPAFTKITGYSSFEVLGKDVGIIDSSWNDERFFKDFWSEINSKGFWQGEVFDKKKNGEVYPKWLTVSTIYNNNDGSVLRRVSIFSDVSDRREKEHIIWRQANFDFLTGLPNRQMFYDRLDQEIKKANRGNSSFALLFIDLDRFKEINDSLGHDYGDVMLKEASIRLSSCVRETDTVARLGGDEFTITLGDIKEFTEIELITREILIKLSAPFYVREAELHISASIGITIYPQDAANVESLLKNADQAMYAAKNKGRNCASYFTPAMQEAILSRMQITNDLRVALSNNQFWIGYQPIVNLTTSEIYKAEALIRWQHPVRGLISPADFIPVAEDTGIIIEIGDWVFKESARQVAKWRQSIHPDFQISINKSPVQFKKEGNPHHIWYSYLKELGIPGKSITIEITEGLLLDADTMVKERLLEFRDAGIQVAIDDFGTGYSALSYIKKFDIDYLKIDRSFVNNMAKDKDDLALCEAIIELAHKLNIKVIAEGIETKEQYLLLKKIGCDYGQGFFWSKAMPNDEFDRYLSGYDKDKLNISA